MKVMRNYRKHGLTRLSGNSNPGDCLLYRGHCEIRPVLRAAAVHSEKRFSGRELIRLQYPEQPPVKEPPNEPQAPPVEDPIAPPGSPPAPNPPPVEDPPNEPKLPPIKEPPPGEPGREGA
jgi:hypothetical protein